MFFISQISYSQAENRRCYEMYYLLEINSLISDTDNSATFPASVKVEFLVITDAQNYFIRTNLLTFDAGNNNKIGSTIEKDSFLLTIKDSIAYLFSTREYYKYESSSLEDKVIKINDLYYEQHCGNLVFKLCDTLPACVKPFPQYVGNKFGIIEIKRGASTLKLTSIKEIAGYSFLNLKLTTNSFRKGNSTLELPF